MTIKNTNLDIRKQEDLSIALVNSDNILMKNYKYNLSSYPVIPVAKEIENLDISKLVRIFKIKSIAYNKLEDNLTKLSNVYNALYAVGGSLILIIENDGDDLDFYIGTKTSKEQDIHVALKTLEKSFIANFPGCLIQNMVKSKIDKIIDNLFQYREEGAFQENRTVSVVSGIPSLRKFAGNVNKTEFVQGIEKLIDSMRGDVYSVVLIADPIHQSQIDTIKKGYEQLYTKLFPFANADIGLGYNEGKTLSDSITHGFSDTVNESLSLSQSHSESISESKGKSYSGGVGMGVFGAGWASGNLSSNNSTSESTSESYTDSVSFGKSKSTSFNLSLSNAISTGESRNMQIKTEEKSVKSLLDRINIQIERLYKCIDLGMWNCATYFISDDFQTCKAAASSYQALMRGEHSGLEAITINTWNYNENNEREKDNYCSFLQYLKKLHHPEFYIGEHLPTVNPTTLISGAELTIQAGLPQRSVSGLAVAEYAAFGREVLRHHNISGSVFSLGNIYHMGNTENMPVHINKESLTAHAFITGSTGSGKSNTVYQILSELSLKKIPFLVIEPAKGEYKHVFGHRDDVYVFGTNPNKTALLKINPFKFPHDIHVLEHIDRLIEIFNVCWPMYAAMPAVLKDAVECAYRSAGWDLDNSLNSNAFPIYPTFQDVLVELHNVINESEYSDELKGNYIGSLVTRVKSLTNGINGQIFECKEIDNEILFDKNVIIDLSRVASIETKAMLMGILVMKLQEYRISVGGINKPLRHVTVLEEAHNLLKRTSTEQSSEGANLIGKSVEMLSQSIAEMRTYGEGFIIVDQSPNMLDMSAIRNTNTKIILRLPDMSDRELSGNAANLNKDQIIELAKLPTGVAAVYQNNWLEPVLCKVDRFNAEETEYVYKRDLQVDSENIKQRLLKFLLAKCAEENVEYAIDDLEIEIMNANLPTYTKFCVVETLKKPESERDFEGVKHAVFSLFDTSKIFTSTENAKYTDEWNTIVLRNINFNFNGLDEIYQNLTLQCVLKELSEKHDELQPMYEKWEKDMRG